MPRGWIAGGANGPIRLPHPDGRSGRAQLPITRTHYYHPAMWGSWSLKAVLPTVAPDLAYAHLDGGVQNVGDVESVYAEILDPATDAARRTELETAMVTYCERDTLALVRLVEFFEAVEPA